MFRCWLLCSRHVRAIGKAVDILYRSHLQLLHLQVTAEGKLGAIGIPESTAFTTVA